jgi:exopolyphosphatase/guanosine-5'-triphosphate,3'-diphosphate pyrophosphatase
VLKSKKKIKRVHREKEMVRLGDGLYGDGMISDEVLDRTKKVFKVYRKEMDRLKIDRTVAFATSALRDAKNSETVRKEIEKSSGIQLEVLSGKEEAELIAEGILMDPEIQLEDFVIIDIGGGSTEVCVVADRSCKAAFSFDLGVARVQQVFLKDVPPKVDPLVTSPQKVLEEHIEKEALPSLDVGAFKGLPLVVSSGTGRAYRKILKKARKPVDPFRLQDLEDLVRGFEIKDRRELLKVDGLEPKRVDLILAGGIVLRKLSNLLKSDKIYITRYALRDGILSQELARL